VRRSNRSRALTDKLVTDYSTQVATVTTAAACGDSRCSLSMCVVQLPTLKGRVHVRYVMQGSVHIHCRRWVKAFADTSLYSPFVTVSANARSRYRTRLRTHIGQANWFACVIRTPTLREVTKMKIVRIVIEFLRYLTYKWVGCTFVCSSLKAKSCVWSRNTSSLLQLCKTFWGASRHLNLACVEPRAPTLIFFHRR